MIVYVVQHTHLINTYEEDTKFIGVYSSYQNAERAIERSKLLPGFVDAIHGFSVDKYAVDEDSWTSGYVTT